LVGSFPQIPDAPSDVAFLDKLGALVLGKVLAADHSFNIANRYSFQIFKQPTNRHKKKKSKIIKEESKRTNKTNQTEDKQTNTPTRAHTQAL
jgi:hypothetical protein